MNDVETMKKAIESLEVVLTTCITDIAMGGVYARTQSSLAMDLINLITYLKKDVAKATKKKGSVKES